MPRITPIDPDNATGKSKELVDQVKEKLGTVPNILATMANSPAALGGYLSFSAALQNGNYDDGLREKIALKVSQKNNCSYCLAAHTTIGTMAGLDGETIKNARKGTGADAKENAILHFASRIVETKGFVSDEDSEAARKAGLNDADLAEIVANVALTLYTNYFNHVADTEIDFPEAPALDCNCSG